MDLSHLVPKKYQESNFVHNQELHLVLLKGEWDVPHVLKRFEKMREIYKQCDIGVTVGSIREVEWKYPGNGLYYDLNNSFNDRYHDGTLQLLADLNIKERPLVLFIDSFDDEIQKVATAFPPSALTEKTIALNTFWITNLANDKDYLKAEPLDYSVFAHELGHVLLDDTHEFGHEKNLMHYSLPMLSRDLTQQQCGIMRARISSGEIKSL